MITDPERYRFVADSLHGVATISIVCTTCSENEDADGHIHVFDFLYPSIADVQKVIDEHERTKHDSEARTLRIAAEIVTEPPRHGYYDDQDKVMKPASERLLVDLARCDTGEGVHVRYLSRGRYHWDGMRGAPYNRASFLPLYANGLIDDDGSEWQWNGPVRVTDAGRDRAAMLEDQAAAKRRPKTKPSAESPSALRALAALAEFTEPVRPHSGDPRGVWRLGSRDGYAAKEATFYALVNAGYAATIRGDFLAVRIVITDAGRERLARRRRA